MSTTPAKARFTNSHPVDSTYHPCCRAIGRHARSCEGVDLAATLAGRAVTSQVWDDAGTELVSSAVHSVDGVATVSACALRTAAGHIVDDPLEDAPSVRLETTRDEITPGQARALAAALIAAADLAEGGQL